MSKESFSEKISESMYKKVKAIEYISPEEFLKQNNQDFVVDSSNLLDEYSRNKMLSPVH